MRIRSSRGRAWLVLIAACIATILSWAHAARGEGGEPRYFAITNARIVPVSGPVINNGTVVIAKGLIQAVGANVAIPPEAWVIDGKGFTVYPGLIDAGTDLGLLKPEEISSGSRSRKSTVPSEIASGPEDRLGATPWRVAADELKNDDKRIATWRNAGFTSALTLPDGGVFPGHGTIINLAGERPGDFVVKPAAGLSISLKPIGGFFSFPGSQMGTIAYVRQVFIDANWFAQAQPVYDANFTKFERLPYDRTERVINQSLRSNEIVLLPANSAVQILRALRLADEWRISVVLLGGQEAYAVTDVLALKKIPVLVSLKWPERPKDADPEGEETLRDLRVRDLAPSAPGALAKVGVKFAFYSDGLVTPKDIFKNLRKALGAGLTADAALRAFTLDAAEILGVSDRLGSLEPGKIANVIVTDGDIFNEKTKVKHSFVDGRWFEVHEEAPPDKPGEKKPERHGEFPEADAAVAR
ncbi:MAG TPA: amidohydrolase family protein [Candidatus Limnocylindria bacterium]|nr:amidohydrolase family protein [Candidatus Limnocylindria bacterium]